MDKRADHKHFFMYHLYDEVQKKYDLTDEEMEKLISFIKKFHGQDAGNALKQIRKRKNKNSLDQIVHQLTNKEMNQERDNEFQTGPVNRSDGLTYPMGLPLSNEIDIYPHYDGGYGHAAM